MTGKEFIEGPWQQVPWLIDQVMELFETKIVLKGGPTLLAKTADSSLSCVSGNRLSPCSRSTLRRFCMNCGSCMSRRSCCPVRRSSFRSSTCVTGTPLGRLKTMYELRIKAISRSTPSLAIGGTQSDRIGWACHDVIRRILETKTMLSVEGPFDLLACRLIAPEVPVISTGTKNFTACILPICACSGSRRMHLLFDGDDVGERAASFLKRKVERGTRLRIDGRNQNCPPEQRALISGQRPVLQHVFHAGFGLRRTVLAFGLMFPLLRSSILDDCSLFGSSTRGEVRSPYLHRDLVSIDWIGAPNQSDRVDRSEIHAARGHRVRPCDRARTPPRRVRCRRFRFLQGHQLSIDRVTQ
jgi:hypothetical protein